MKITEQLLWRYIDQDCTAEEANAIEQAIKTDATVKEEYLKLLSFHNNCLNLFARLNSEKASPYRRAKMQGKIKEDPQQISRRSEN